MRKIQNSILLLLFCTFSSIAQENDFQILPNGVKTSSYRYEDKTGGLEVLRQDDNLLAVLLKNKDRKRNPKATLESVTFSDDVE